ncbi:tRNA-guanine transglycosylase, partial [bacterium]|nr:tRNA-guanine transglycosylase [bacterium]
MKFEIVKKLDGNAVGANPLGRAGKIETPHGVIETPAFITVGTKATVKALVPEQVVALGAQAVLANTYHLYLQPGEDVLRKAGGLGKFMGWTGPTFTDSGGFQVFSLGSAFDKKVGKISGKASVQAVSQTAAEKRNDDTSPHEALARIDEDGVTFKSVIDGSTHRFT